ncbi:MAG TPA: hypothetical protein VEF04_11455 [Blastocatellia bacterium]|nr:hypothetical protein [Blastocatellia bacterium]
MKSPSPQTRAAAIPDFLLQSISVAHFTGLVLNSPRVLGLTP